MVIPFVRLCILCGIILLQPLSTTAHAEGQNNAATTATVAAPQAPAGENPSSEKPFLSPPFDDTPVAMVADEPITKYDMSVALSQQQEQANGQTGKEQYLRTLDRLITTRLIVLEAINIGLHETKDFQRQIEGFKRKRLQVELMQLQTQGLEPDPAEVDKLYRRMSREVMLDSFVFPEGPQAALFREEAGKKDADFERLAQRFVEEGKTKKQKEESYVKIKDLRAEVAQEAYVMEVGSISKIYRTEDGLLLYRLADDRFVEDEAVREEAYQKILANAKSQKAIDYSYSLADKYVTFDEELYKQLDFDANMEKLLEDKRILAQAKEGQAPFVVTVADLAAELKRSFFHGAEKASTLQMLNKRKESAIANMIFEYTSQLEAHSLGLDLSESFLREMKEFERSTLFSVFMGKMVLPELKVAEEEARAYYDEHIEEYSSPSMVRLKSLVFNNLKGAESALDKLRKGADYNWVSANSVNLVAPDTKDVLPLDKNLLSLTALPEDLQKHAENAKKGDFLLYAPDQGNFVYVLQVEEAFPPEPKPYDQVRAEVGRKIYAMKGEKLLAEWTAKLKEEYPVRLLPQDAGK